MTNPRLAFGLVTSDRSEAPTSMLIPVRRRVNREVMLVVTQPQPAGSLSARWQVAEDGQLICCWTMD